MTKNAIIGKAHRIGLALRGNPSKPARVHTATLITFPPKGQCQWADADPQSLAFQFCGKKVEDLDSVWCPEHRERVYIRGSASKIAAD